MYGSARDLSFANLHASVMVPFALRGKRTVSPSYDLKGLSFVSWSTHRDKFVVGSTGTVNAKGFTYGRRTVAGTLGFNILDESPWADLLREYGNWIGRGRRTYKSHIDELPPFDMSLLFMDRHNPMNSTHVLLTGVSVVDVTHSVAIQDIQLTGVYSFMAMGITELVDPQLEVRREIEETVDTVSLLSSFVTPVAASLVLGPSGTAEVPSPYTTVFEATINPASGWAKIHTMNEGDELTVEANGSVVFADGACSLPEGAYPDFSCDNPYDPNGVVWHDPAFPPDYATNVPPYALAVMIVPAGSPPPTTVSTALRPNRGTTFSAAQIMRTGGTGPYDVYAVYNNLGDPTNNTGSFTCTFTRVSK